MAGPVYQDMSPIAQIDFGFLPFGDFGDSSLSPFISSKANLERFASQPADFDALIHSLEKQLQQHTSVSGKQPAVLSITRAFLAALSNFFGALICVKGESRYGEMLISYAGQAESVYLLMKKTVSDEDLILFPQIERLLNQLSLNDLCLLAAQIHIFILSQHEVDADVFYYLEKNTEVMTSVASGLSSFLTMLMTIMSFHIGYRMFRAIDEGYTLIPNMTLSTAIQSISTQHVCYLIDALFFLVVKNTWRRLREILRLQKDGLSADFIIDVLLSYYFLSEVRSFSTELYAQHERTLKQDQIDEDWLLALLSDVEHFLMRVFVVSRVPIGMTYQLTAWLIFQDPYIDRVQAVRRLFPMSLITMIKKLQGGMTPHRQSSLALSHCLRLIERYQKEEDTYFLSYVEGDFWSQLSYIGHDWLDVVQRFWQKESDFMREVFEPALSMSVKQLTPRYPPAPELLCDIALADAWSILLGSYDLVVFLYGKEDSRTQRLVDELHEFRSLIETCPIRIRFGDHVGIAQMKFMSHILSSFAPDIPLVYALYEQIDQRKNKIAAITTQEDYIRFCLLIDKKLGSQFRVLMRPVMQEQEPLLPAVWHKWHQLLDRYRKKKRIRLERQQETIFLFMTLFLLSHGESRDMLVFLSACPDPIFLHVYGVMNDSNVIWDALQNIATFQRDALSLLGLKLFKPALHFFRYLLTVRKSLLQEAERRVADHFDAVEHLCHVFVSDLSIDHLYQKMVMRVQDFNRLVQIQTAYQEAYTFAGQLGVQWEQAVLQPLRQYDFSTDYVLDMHALTEEQLFLLKRVFLTLRLSHWLSIFASSFERLTHVFQKEIDQLFQAVLEALSKGEKESFLVAFLHMAEKLSLLVGAQDMSSQERERFYEKYMSDCFTRQQMHMPSEQIKKALNTLRESTVMPLRNYIEMYAHMYEDREPKKAYVMLIIAQLLWPFLDDMLHVFFGIKHIPVRQLNTSLEVLSQDYFVMLCRVFALDLDEAQGFLANYRDRPLKYKRHVQC